MVKFVKPFEKDTKSDQKVIKSDQKVIKKWSWVHGEQKANPEVTNQGFDQERIPSQT